MKYSELVHNSFVGGGLLNIKCVCPWMLTSFFHKSCFQPCKFIVIAENLTLWIILVAKLLKNTNLLLGFASIPVFLATENTFMAFPFLSMNTSALQIAGLWSVSSRLSVSAALYALCVYAHKGKLNLMLYVCVCPLFSHFKSDTFW